MDAPQGCLSQRAQMDAGGGGYRDALQAAREMIASLERAVKERDQEIERLSQMLAECGVGVGLGPNIKVSPMNHDPVKKCFKCAHVVDSLISIRSCEMFDNCIMKPEAK